MQMLIVPPDTWFILKFLNKDQDAGVLLKNDCNNPLMNNVPKWSDTLSKSYNNYCKISKKSQTILVLQKMLGLTTVVDSFAVKLWTCICIYLSFNDFFVFGFVVGYFLNFFYFAANKKSH